MLKNYLKIAVRTIKKRKLYSILNVTGLGIGLASSILILLWVRDELSYDRFHKNYNNIYRIVEDWHLSDGQELLLARSAYPLGPALKNSFPEVVESVPLFPPGRRLIKFKEQSYYEDKFTYTNQAFFKVFSFPLVQGDPETVFKNLNSIVISESIALKYFKDEDPVGKSLKMNNRTDYLITGIMKDMPDNSHLQFDLIANIESIIERGYDCSWNNHNYFIYIQLKEGIEPVDFGRKIKTFIHDKDALKIDISNQPLKDIHLRSNYSADFGGKSQPKYFYIYIFSVIAVIILIIGCVNFINLATAQSANRTKEISLRKVVGAHRHNVATQFIFETFIISFFALLFALILISILLPEFNSLAGKNFSLIHFKNHTILIGLLTIPLITGLVAGWYPALYLSSFQPVNVLKGILHGAFTGKNFRNILVIVQFSLSLILLIGTIVVRDQIAFMKNRNLGIKKDNIVYFPLKGTLYDRYETIKTELIKHPDILDITSASSIPTNITDGNSGIDWEGRNENENISWQILSMDYDFIDIFGLEIIDGRNFSREFSTDISEAYIINKTGADIIGIEQAVGKRFIWGGREGKIIGVIKDFHFRPLREKVQPLLIVINPQWRSHAYLFIKVNSEQISNVINAIKNVYKKFNPEFPFEFYFMNEEYAKLYVNEERVSKLFGYFSILAIIILCLGLFGLSSFVAEKRKKEIGIRKVLGAKKSGLIVLLSKEFLRSIFIASAFAWPLGYICMKNWLNNFAYRINIGILPFIISGILAVFIAVLTVSYQTIKAARANPIDSLRHE